MILFYMLETKHLIAVPTRNGSSHLYNNMAEYGLMNVTYKPFFDSIIDEVERKTFIYRDPMTRFLSFYEKFIYVPILEKNKNLSSGSPKNRTYKNFTKYFNITTRGEDLLSDIILAKDKIEKNYLNDVHTQPQYTFFKDDSYNQKLEEYEVISASQYVKWLKLTFAADTTHVVSRLEQMNLTINGFINMQTIQNMCNRLYEEDYKFLEPRVTTI